jgi:hypothetical protein
MIFEIKDICTRVGKAFAMAQHTVFISSICNKIMIFSEKEKIKLINELLQCHQEP